MDRRTKTAAVEGPAVAGVAVEHATTDSIVPIIAESYGNDDFDKDVRMQQSAAGDAEAAGTDAPLCSITSDVPQSLCRTSVCTWPITSCDHDSSFLIISGPLLDQSTVMRHCAHMVHNGKQCNQPPHKLPTCSWGLGRCTGSTTQFAEERPILCSLKGLYAGLSGGALGYVFGYGNFRSLFTSLHKLDHISMIEACHQTACSG